MGTNVELDDELIEQADRIDGHKTNKGAVTAALQEYVLHHTQQKIIAAFGTFDFESQYDYKTARRNRRPMIVSAGSVKNCRTPEQPLA